MHHLTDRIAYIMAFVSSVVEQDIAQRVHNEGSIRRPIAPWANALTMELHLAPYTIETKILNLKISCTTMQKIKRLTCTFRASCYSTHLSWTLDLTWVSPFVQNKKVWVGHLATTFALSTTIRFVDLYLKYSTCIYRTIFSKSIFCLYTYIHMHLQYINSCGVKK